MWDGTTGVVVRGSTPGGYPVSGVTVAPAPALCPLTRVAIAPCGCGLTAPTVSASACPPARAVTSAACRLDVNVVGFSDKVLYPFYGRLIQAVTGVRDGLPSCPASAPVSLKGECAYPDLGLRTNKLMVFEPMAVRMVLGLASLLHTRRRP